MGKSKFIIGGIIIFIAIAALSFVAFRGAATYYYTVDEVIGQESTLADENIRVAGQVVPGSLIQANSQTNTISFTLINIDKPDKLLSVQYKGAVPDAFKEGNEAVVEGRLSSPGLFNAQQIIVKCPSKYEPKQ